jgi:hypothetical protein
MSIVVETKSYELPDEGVHNAELIDVQDLGIVSGSRYGDKRRIRFRYRVDQVDLQGERITVIESFNAALGKGSRLGARVVGLTGRHPGNGYDLTQLIGWRGQIVIEHNDVGDRTYANVTTALRKKAATDDGVPWNQ